jgi:hypothetical protein
MGVFVPDHFTVVCIIWASVVWPCPAEWCRSTDCS